MDKNVTKIIVAVLLIIIAIFTVTNSLKKSKAKKQEFINLPTQEVVLAPKEEVSPKKTGVSAPVKTTVIQEKKETDVWKRDPFIIIEKDLADIERKFSAKTELKRPELSQLKLTGIIFAKENSADNYAVITDQLLRVGDQIFGFKVKEIRPNSVILKWENQEFILELWQEERK